jgi:hypothetical protein
VNEITTLEVSQDKILIKKYVIAIGIAAIALSVNLLLTRQYVLLGVTLVLYVVLGFFDVHRTLGLYYRKILFSDGYFELLSRKGSVRIGYEEVKRIIEKKDARIVIEAKKKYAVLVNRVADDSISNKGKIVDIIADEIKRRSGLKIQIQYYE